MTNHKFTDEQIIRCLNECYGKKNIIAHIVDRGEEALVTLGMILDIIERQKAEIEEKRDQSLYLATKIHEKNAEIERLQSALERANYYGLKADDEIEYLKAEIERLTTELAGMRGAANSYKMHYENAIKEFAERAKEKMNNLARMEYGSDEIYFLIGKSFIDNLVKGMTEENK